MQIRCNNHGIALIGVLIAMVFLTALAATLASKVLMDTQTMGAFGQSMTGFYAAESGLNEGMAEFKTEFLNYQVPSGSDFNPRSRTLGQRNVSYQLTERASDPFTITIPAGQLFAGLNSQEYGYTVRSSAVNTVSSDIEATVGANFLVGNIPLFQFVAFYANDLEILPGANMTLLGRIHTNGDLYLNAESGITVAVQDNQAVGINTVQVSAKGNIYRGRKNISACSGTVNIDMLQDIVAPLNDLDPQTMSCVGSGTTQIPVSTLTTWKGSVISQVSSISVPQPDIIARPPQGTGIYWTKADLRIALLIGVPGQLPGGPWLPASIVVQDASGNIDATKTTLLQTFMTSNQNNGTYTNGAPSSLTGIMSGTRPIYYTEVPQNNFILSGLANATACTCSNANPGCNSTNPSCYPQLNQANTAVFANNRPIGEGVPGNINTVNNAGQAYNVAQYDRTYGSNAFTGVGGGMLGDLDYRRGGFYNWREGMWMYLLNINVGDLLQWNRFQPANSKLFDNADASDGGLVFYFSVVGLNSNAASNNYGVRVFGSENLWFPTNPGVGVDPTGVTIVSDQAMYVEGHFNRGNVSPNPGGNLPKQPAAVIADSINVLSTAYRDNTAGTCRNDCQSSTGLTAGSRGAGSTWINAGFLAGVDNTTAGNYNGGLENYPRFHESWSGSTLNYWGSFVSLGTPQHVDGPWCGTGTGCNIYNPPTRSFNYDPFFNNVANLPPLTPRFVYVQQVLFTEDFK